MTNKIDIEPDGDTLRREAFGLRLKIATMLRYRRVAHFIEVLTQGKITTRAGFYYHLQGKHPPAARVKEQYEQLLNLPRGWLDGPPGPPAPSEMDLLKEGARAIDDGDLDNAALQKVIGILQSRESNVLPLPVNHQVKQSAPDSGKFVSFRYIPILSDAEINALTAGERLIETMSGAALPVPESLGFGRRTFIYQLAETDFSMTGIGDRSYSPGAALTIDPDAQIVPGRSILVRHRDHKTWMVRRYKAALPPEQAKTYKLEAINPSFETIEVDNPADWVIGGLVVWVSQAG